jgi:hypothetical protein
VRTTSDEVVELLVGGERQLAGLVHTLLALLDLFGRGWRAAARSEPGERSIPSSSAARSSSSSSLAHLDLAALVRQDVDVERERPASPSGAP